MWYVPKKAEHSQGQGERDEGQYTLQRAALLQLQRACRGKYGLIMYR